MTQRERRPRGYVGRGHETIGSDILAVLEALTMPKAVLGEELLAWLEGVDPDAWYPIDAFLDLLERLDETVGRHGLIKTGRRLFALSHEATATRVAGSARDVIYGIDGMYRAANRGIEIGGWEVLEFGPGTAVLEKTTPHHCALEEGILDAALRAVDAPSRIQQTRCFRLGDHDACRFEVISVVTGAGWTGE